MPRSCSAPISDGSVYLAGGVVTWLAGISSRMSSLLPDGQVRQPAFGVIGLAAGLRVDGLDVGAEEAGERDGPAGR